MALTKVSGDILDTGIVVAGVTTSTNFKTGTSNLHNVGIEIAGINVLGADTPIGAGVTIYNSGGADFTGVVTATRFVGQADISGGSIIATTGTFSGDVSIGGTLTYQDVTNIDSVGIVTARSDIRGGRNLNVTGITTLTGNVTTQADVKFASQSIDNAVNWGKVSNILQVRDGTKLTFGNSNDLQLYHNSSNSFIDESGTGSLYISAASDIYLRAYATNKTMFRGTAGGEAGLYYNNTKRLSTSGIGVTVAGTIDLDAISTTS